MLTTCNRCVVFRGLLVNTANTVVTEAVKFYFTGSDLPVSPALLAIRSSCNAQCVHDAVDAWLTHVPEDYDSLWMVSDCSTSVCLPLVERTSHAVNLA